MRQDGSMSKGCVRNSRKGCVGRAAGRAVRIDEVLWCESRPTLKLELPANHRQTGNCIPPAHTLARRASLAQSTRLFRQWARNSSISSAPRNDTLANMKKAWLLLLVVLLPSPLVFSQTANAAKTPATTPTPSAETDHAGQLGSSAERTVEVSARRLAVG